METDSEVAGASWPVEFKRDAVELVRSTGRPDVKIASELGIHDSPLGNWVRQDRIDPCEAEGLPTEEQAQHRAEARLAARGAHHRPQLVRHQVVSEGRHGEMAPGLPQGSEMTS